MDRDQTLFRLFGKFCPEGTILYTEGAPGEEVYLVQSGSVRLGPAAGEAAREVGEGGILGEEAFFARSLRPRRAEILRDCRLLQLADRNLDSLARNGPEAALAVLGELVGLGAGAGRELAAWSFARTLRRTETVLRRSSPGDLTAEDVARGTGVTGRDAQALLEELERLGVAVRTPAGFRIPDTDLLDRAARGVAGEGA